MSRQTLSKLQKKRGNKKRMDDYQRGRSNYFDYHSLRRTLSCQWYKEEKNPRIQMYHDERLHLGQNIHTICESLTNRRQH